MIRHFLYTLFFIGIVSCSYASHTYSEDDYLTWESSSSSASSVGYEEEVDDLEEFSARLLPRDGSSQPVSKSLLDFDDLNSMFLSEGDAVLVGMQRQLASQQEDISFLKARLEHLVHQSSSRNEPIMFVEPDRSTSKEAASASKKSYEALSFKEKVIYKLKVVKEKIKNFYHKHGHTILKGAIAIAIKIAGLILISFL